MQGGTSRPLFALTPKRLPYFPDIPTADEVGLPGLHMSTWFGMMAPKGTPSAIVEQLNGYARAMLDDPAVQKRLADSRLEPMPMTTAEFAAFLKSETPLWETRGARGRHSGRGVIAARDRLAFSSPGGLDALLGVARGADARARTARRPAPARRLRRSCSASSNARARSPTRVTVPMAWTPWLRAMPGMSSGGSEKRWPTQEFSTGRPRARAIFSWISSSLRCVRLLTITIIAGMR